MSWCISRAFLVHLWGPRLQLPLLRRLRHFGESGSLSAELCCSRQGPFDVSCHMLSIESCLSMLFWLPFLNLCQRDSLVTTGSCPGRYIPGERRSHAVHFDGHAYVTAVLGISDPENYQATEHDQTEGGTQKIRSTK